MQTLVKRNSKLDDPNFDEEWSVLFRISRVVKPLLIFFTKIKLNVLNFFILPRNIREKVILFRIWNGAVIYWWVFVQLSLLASFRYLGALFKKCRFATLLKITNKFIKSNIKGSLKLNVFKDFTDLFKVALFHEICRTL